MVGGANVVRRRVLGSTWFPVVKFKGAGLLLVMGVWLAAMLLVVGVCTCVTPAVTAGDWWATVFVVAAGACTPGGEGWCIVGFNAADSAAATGNEVFTPPIAAGVGI